MCLLWSLGAYPVHTGSLWLRSQEWFPIWSELESKFIIGVINSVIGHPTSIGHLAVHGELFPLPNRLGGWLMLIGFIHDRDVPCISDLTHIYLCISFWSGKCFIMSPLLLHCRDIDVGDIPFLALEMSILLFQPFYFLFHFEHRVE